MPSFGARASRWALALNNILRVRPLAVRLVGLLAALLFTVTALQIFAGVHLTPTTSPLPFNASPVLAVTLAGWIWTLMKDNGSLPGGDSMEFLWFALIGICAGWLAGQITKGSGFGLLVDLIVGVIGALVGGFLLALVGIAAYGLLGRLIVATMGAIVLLALLRFLRRQPGI